MTRTTCAFLIAPLCVPAAVALIFGALGAELSGILAAASVSLVVAYAGMCVLGVPAFRYFKWKRTSRLSIALTYGIGIAIVIWWIFLFLVMPAASGKPILQTFYQSFSLELLLAFVAAPALLGVLVTLAFWAIAKPDRTES